MKSFKYVLGQCQILSNYQYRLQRNVRKMIMNTYLMAGGIPKENLEME